MAKRRKLSSIVNEAEVVSAETVAAKPLLAETLPDISGVVKAVAAGDQAQTIEELREQLAIAKSAQNANPEQEKNRVVDAIFSGRLSIELHPNWLIDQVGTDRDDPLGNSLDDDGTDFEKFAADIEQNGQMQPIRVRVSADTPEIKDALYSLANRMILRETHALDETPPPELDGRLFLQSGRRRRSACELKGLPVLAFVSSESSQGITVEAADLLERYRENALRSDLSGWEKIRSIAQIKKALPELSQKDLAQRLGIGRGDVSVAADAVELEADIEALHGPDFRNRGIRWFRKYVPITKKWVAEGRPGSSQVAEIAPKPMFTPIKAELSEGRVDLSNGIRASLGRNGSIKIETQEGGKPSADQVEFILEAIAKGAGRVKLSDR